MDIQMPIMDGAEATKIIRKGNGVNKDTTIIALTAHAMKEEQEHFLSIGMNACLFKPFKAEEFNAIIIEYAKNE